MALVDQWVFSLRIHPYHGTVGDTSLDVQEVSFRVVRDVRCYFLGGMDVVKIFKRWSIYAVPELGVFRGGRR